jgi:hypothetical protein
LAPDEQESAKASDLIQIEHRMLGNSFYWLGDDKYASLYNPFGMFRLDHTGVT